MKDKEMIEEMAKIIGLCYCDKECQNKCAYCDISSLNEAKKLYEIGFRKLPKDSVVLSKEEYEKLKNESIDKLFADDTFFKEEFKANEEYLRKRANRDYIKLVKNQSSKETARNIADWINYRAENSGFGGVLKDVLKELSETIKTNYKVEIKE